MPRTGQLTGRRINLRFAEQPPAILNVEKNNSQARYQLSAHRARHQQWPPGGWRRPRTTPAPNRVREWLPDNKPLDADAWVDTVAVQ